MGAFKAFNPDRDDDILPIYTNAGTPDGTTGAGVAIPGSLCIDTTNKVVYKNDGTLTNAKRARFTCVAANTIISSQLGVPSA